MNKKRIILMLCILFAIIIGGASIFLLTDKTNNPSDQSIFDEYISYTTKGYIYRNGHVKIMLAQPIPSWKEGDELPSGLLDIEPYVDGELEVVNGKSIIFTPKQLLKSEVTYYFTINLEKLFPSVPSELEEFTFMLSTHKLDYNLSLKELISTDIDHYSLEGKVIFSDVVSYKDVLEMLTAKHEGANLEVKLSEPPNHVGSVFTFTINNILQHQDPSLLRIECKGRNMDHEAKIEVKVPAKGSFLVTASRVFENSIHVAFSQPLKKNQNLYGLVSLGNTEVSLDINQNILIIYTSSSIPQEELTLIIREGVENILGQKLKERFEERISFRLFAPQAKFISKGDILPYSQNLHVYFEAINLKAVDVRIIKVYENNHLDYVQAGSSADNYWTLRDIGKLVAVTTVPLIQSMQEDNNKWRSYAIDISKYVDDEPGAVYRIELFYELDYALTECNRGEYDYSYTPATMTETEKKFWNNRGHQTYYDYSWREREDPCKESYYNYRKEYDKMPALAVYASNIGLIAKEGQNGTYIFATTDLLTAKPLANVNISLFTYQKQLIATLRTDDQGLAKYHVEDEVVYFVTASKDGQVTYKRIGDGGSLSMSNFNVSGVKLERGMKGFIYGERGVWRPGDTLYLTFVLDNKGGQLPDEQPAKMTVNDPGGKEIYTATARGTGGFYSFAVPTSVDDKTGTWIAKVDVGGAIFRKNLRVETIKPNRLKIALNFHKEAFQERDNISGDLQVNWLHGSPGKRLKVKSKVEYQVIQQYFKKQVGYVFTDPLRTSFVSSSFEHITDEQGGIDFNISPQQSGLREGGYGGPLRVTVLNEAYEKSGEFSTSSFSTHYLPYRSFVGLKSPKGTLYNGSYELDKDVPFQILTLHANGKPKGRSKVTVKVFKLKWRWWWNVSSRNLSSYKGDVSSEPIKVLQLTTDQQGQGFATIKLNSDNSHGRYLVRVFDEESGHSVSKVCYFLDNWWSSNSAGTGNEYATILTFDSDKERYQVGETATLNFPSSVGGTALVSIENNEGVINTIWVNTTQRQTSVEVSITEEMIPNVYMNISYIQPHAYTENDLPIRLYGVLPISVESEKTHITPVIDMPKELEPEKTFSVEVSEKNGESMSYTIAIVDEGLLGITGFRTPQIWSSFHAKTALGVKTWDVFDEVIGAYGGSINQIFAIGGGDDNLQINSPKKVNRFKPVDVYLGPFHLKKNETAKHTIKLPNYVGSVRTMVVAGNTKKGAYGSTEVLTPVRKPVMVLGTLPRKLSPKEKVTLPVTIFTMKKEVKRVDITVKTSGGLKLLASNKQQVSFSSPGEKMIYFDMEVANQEGTATLDITAKGDNGDVSSYNIDVDIVNPNLVETKVIDVQLDDQSLHNIELEPFGIAGSNEAILELSTFPSINFSGRMEYLISYPHGCVEQTTSSIFPQLFLSSIFELPLSKRKEIEANIKEGINRLIKFQTTDGGLSYWMGGSNSNDWGTTYAGHFMIEAEKRGYAVPKTFMSQWLRYQQNLAQKWNENIYTSLSQAYRLYTLALAGYPNLSAMNRLKERTGISNIAKYTLATAYALINQKRIARLMISKTSLEIVEDRQLERFTYGSVDRNRAMMMEALLILGDNRYLDLAKSIAKSLSSNSWMSTQTTAYCLMSIAKMIEANGGKEIDTEYAIEGQKERLKTAKGMTRTDLTSSDKKVKLKLKNQLSNATYARIIQTGKPAMGDEVEEARNLRVVVTYTDEDGRAIDISSLKQDQEITAKITVTNLSGDRVNDLALTALFPSGWELKQERDPTMQVDYIDYRDDRASYYFSLKPQSSKTFKAVLNASYIGRYYLPGIQAEAMYDNNYYHRSKGRWISVTK